MIMAATSPEAASLLGTPVARVEPGADPATIAALVAAGVEIVEAR